MNRFAPVFHLLTATVLAWACCGCASTTLVGDPNVSFDLGAPFSSYRTYAWDPDVRTSYGNPRLDQPRMHAFIRSEVEAALAAKSFQPAPAESADVLLNYQVALDTEEHSVLVDEMQGNVWTGERARARRGYSYGELLPKVQVDTFEVGKLVLEIADRRRNQLVWYGSAQAYVHQDQAEDVRRARVREALRKLLDDFPPRP